MVGVTGGTGHRTLNYGHNLAHTPDRACNSRHLAIARLCMNQLVKAAKLLSKLKGF
jgi:hypothetical protein